MSELTHTCIFCEAKLESKEALRDHFRKHANNEIAFKKPNKKKEKLVKLENSSASPTFQCDVCSMEFKTNATLIAHRVRKHPQESKIKYFCSYCGRQFPLKMNRDKHIDMEHSKELEKNSESHENDSEAVNYSCQICNCQFFNKYAFDFHNTTNHSRVMSLFAPIVTPPPSNKIRVDSAGFKHSVYYCHLCGLEYINKFNFRKHLELRHTENERIKAPQELIRCKVCCALFYTKKAFDSHNVSHSSDDVIVVNEFERLQTVSRTDLDYDVRRVSAISTVDKYIPTESKRIRRPDQKKKSPKKEIVKTESDEELSPVSDYGSSSDEECTLDTKS